MTAFSLLGFSAFHCGFAAQSDFVRFSKPELFDWFFVKGLATDSRKPGAKYQFAPHFAWTLLELNNAPEESLSDHFPITVDLPLTEPPPLAASPNP